MGIFSRVSRGFSLVELITALVLIGIVSATVITRILPANTFDTALARDQIIALARSAQQKATGRSNVTLTVRPSGRELQLSISDTNGQVQTATTSIRNVSLSGDVNVLDSCAATPGTYAITASSPMVIEFAWPGDLSRGGVSGSPDYPETVSTGIRICLNNDPPQSICLSASGFAYTGDCRDA